MLPVALVTALLLISTPDGFSSHVWHFFAVFAGAIVGLVLESLPGAVTDIAAVVTIAIFSPWVLFSP